jgi:shikimate kinase
VSTSRAASAGPLVVLVGPPGAGKSTVGRLVAERTGTQFRDTDADVERQTGRRVAELFVEFGEPHFRALERAAVHAALAGHRGVLALGGGAVADPDVRAALTGRPVVFLDAELPDLTRRVGLDTARPLLPLNPRAELSRLLRERRPHYLAVATATVSTAGRTAEQVADAVLGALSAALGRGVPSAPEAR